MTIHPAHRTLCLAFLTACGAPSTAADPADVATLVLSDAPTLDIGVVEGDDDYVFQDVASVFDTAGAYGVRASGTRAPLPTWLTAVESREPVDAPDQDAFMDEVRTAFRGMARAQEIHYATAMTYTARLDSLEWERPEEVVVDVINAGPRGWVAVFTHPGLDRICALGYGYTVPPGWAPGGVLCGPPAASPTREG